ncbi:unnamed protein product [Paramecium pentaurelia]|uniref:Uncharacterized protein n=1 Tax=Paramecium pentaurelia TaxID=43138 RepID=A0A8S1TBM2_9CILI|nr:unnamed protein product [Paramecium pentaurelia]
MFNNNSPLVFSTCIQGRHFFAFPIYFIKLNSETQNTKTQEFKLEEKNHQKQEEIHIQYKEHTNPKINHNSYIYPGQSKNYYKTLGNKLSIFIQENFDETEIREDQNIQQFIQRDSKKYNREHFKYLIKSKKGRQIIKLYFGNYLWCSSVLKQARSDIDFYLNLNQQIFKKKKKNLEIK